ncbi:LytR/AlgR family response regulator transcription factor [Sediminibacterium sp.]|uniref:LytR/AlgR family response regulator transcription factor n=1 Tax=Sediminibacterium sp. TaxID=1917865 RepID=UPI003F70514D
MEILIIEKEYPIAEKLCKMLHDYNLGSLSVHYAVNKEQLKKILINHSRLDYIFFDITLGDEYLVQLLNEHSKESPLIFLTNQSFIPTQPISANYIDYLIKPLTELNLGKVLLKYERFKFQHLGATGKTNPIFYSSRDANYKKRFLIHLGTRMFFVETKDIAYFFVSEKNVYLVNLEGIKYPIDYSLEKLQQLVDPLKFFRINRKIICSTRSIREIKTYINSRLKIILAAGNNSDEAVVSREKVTAFKEWVEG